MEKIVGKFMSFTHVLNFKFRNIFHAVSPQTPPQLSHHHC